MNTSVEQVDRWLQVPSEHERLEFKQAKSQIDNRTLFEYCVAIANEGGGKLLLGVEDTAPRRIVGTSACSNPTKMAEKIFDNVRFRVDVEALVHPCGRVVICHIPSRPVGTAYHFDGRYLMRSGSSLVSMTEDRLRQIFAEGKPDWIEEYSLDSLDSQEVVELLDTQSYFELMRLPFPSTRDGIIEQLVRERLVDQVGSHVAIKRIGALLLARRLEDFPDIARKAPRVIVYSGDSKLNTRLDQIGTKGYAVGFQGLVDFVMNQLPQNEVIEDALRHQVKLLPEIVVRELVANALMHQDFSVAGTSMMVEIYDNRVEISNPGMPIVPVERFIDSCQSRNERLGSLMRRMGICEEQGSGIDKVFDAAEVYQLPAPDLRAGHNRASATIYGPMSFNAMDRSNKIRSCFQHCALKWVTGEHMTNQSLRERFQLDPSKTSVVSQVIAAAISEGLVKSDEGAGASRKYARYVPFWA